MAIYWQIEFVHKGKRKFWTRIKSKNRKIVWTSEIYTTKSNALRPALKLVRDLGDKAIIKEKTK